MMTDCKINAFKAVERGNCRKLKEFLSIGVENWVQKTDPKYNATLLHWAALRNQVACAELCIKAGADLEAKTDTNGTPLMWACMEGSFDMVTSLLRRGADVTSVTTSLATPMHHAASYGHAKVVSILLSHGANPTVEDAHGNRPGDKFFSDVSEDCRRKVIQELEGALERSNVDVRPSNNKVTLGSRLWREKVEEDQIHSSTLRSPALDGEYGKSKKIYDSVLPRVSSQPDAAFNINDLIRALDETKAVAKTAFEELVESEAAVVTAIAARKSCGEKYHAAVMAMEAAASAFALELRSKEQRLSCLESEFRSREIELKSALETKEKESNEFKYRLEGVNGAVDNIRRLSSHDRMDELSYREYSQKGCDAAVAGSDIRKNDKKNGQMEEFEIRCCSDHLPEATATTCGILNPIRTSSWCDEPQRYSVQEKHIDVVTSSPENITDDTNAEAVGQSQTEWQLSKTTAEISSIPYLYSLLAAGK